MSQQPVLDHQGGDRAGATGVEDGIVAYAEAAGDEKLRALFRQDSGLEFWIAHGFVLKLGLDLFQAELFFVEAAILAADAVELEALLLIIAGNIACFGVEADAEGHAQLLVAHGLGKFCRFLETGDIAVKGALHIGGSLHNLAFFLIIGSQNSFPVDASAVYSLGIAGVGLAVGTISFHGEALLNNVLAKGARQSAGHYFGGFSNCI